MAGAKPPPRDGADAFSGAARCGRGARSRTRARGSGEALRDAAEYAVPPTAEGFGAAGGGTACLVPGDRHRSGRPARRGLNPVGFRAESGADRSRKCGIRVRSGREPDGIRTGSARDPWASGRSGRRPGGRPGDARGRVGAGVHPGFACPPPARASLHRRHMRGQGEKGHGKPWRADRRSSREWCSPCSGRAAGVDRGPGTASRARRPRCESRRIREPRDPRRAHHAGPRRLVLHPSLGRLLGGRHKRVDR